MATVGHICGLSGEIKQKHFERREWLKSRKGNKRLVETFGGIDVEDTPSAGCLVCHL